MVKQLRHVWYFLILSQYRCWYSCNEVPFFHKSRKQIENKKPNELSKILDREKLDAFQNKLNETEKLYDTALNRQGDDLCNGKHIRENHLFIFKDILR